MQYNKCLTLFFLKGRFPDGTVGALILFLGFADQTPGYQ
jgi:hypothetical protein